MLNEILKHPKHDDGGFRAPADKEGEMIGIESGLEDRLSPQDKVNFQKGVGLVRGSRVNPTYYNHHYFSEDHIAYADGYTLDRRLKKYQDAIENIIQLLVLPILDLGCGPGFIVEGLRRRGVIAQGVDISEEAVGTLSPETVRELLTNAPLTQLPFETGQFESGYSFHVLEHLTQVEIDEALAEISRVVKKRLYLIIPTWDSLTDPVLFDQIIKDPTHRVIVNRRWWIEKFARFGWEHNDQIEHELDRLNRGWVFFFERDDNE